MKKRDDLHLPDKDADIKKYLSIKHSFPIWLIDKWEKQFGIEKCEEILEASNQRPQLSIRANLMKTSRDELKEQLTQLGFEVVDGEFSNRTLHIKGSGLLDSPLFRGGLFSVQDEASTVAADTVDGQRGETIIDVCAAPGGKTSAIAEMMANQGRVISCDVYEHKLELIRNISDRLGLTIVEPTLLDGTVGNDKWENIADRVLVDAPCSGLGVIRRKPEIKYKNISDFSELVNIQKQILYNAAGYVKPGGVLVYSTCTINDEENEKQISNFLAENDDFELVFQRQFLPTQNIDGFYVCKMIKCK